VVSIAYYTVILWAGVVSGYQAVFFAVVSSCFLFSLVVLLEHYGIFLSGAPFKHGITDAQMFSSLLGNIAFLCAFGYFSAYSSKIIKFLERKRFEEKLKSTHRFLATGYLVAGIAHDVINHLASVRGYVSLLLDESGKEKSEDRISASRQMLESINKLESEDIGLLSKLAKFSLKQKEQIQPVNLYAVFDEVLTLTSPLAQMSRVLIERSFGKAALPVMVDRAQLREALVNLMISVIADMPEKGRLNIEVSSSGENTRAQIVFRMMGSGLKHDLTQELEYAIAQEITSRYSGTIEILNGTETKIIIRIPICPE
jgi:signal transduction histidine kinase